MVTCVLYLYKFLWFLSNSCTTLFFECDLSFITNTVLDIHKNVALPFLLKCQCYRRHHFPLLNYKKIKNAKNILSFIEWKVLSRILMSSKRLKALGGFNWLARCVTAAHRNADYVTMHILTASIAAEVSRGSVRNPESPGFLMHLNG